MNYGSVHIGTRQDLNYREIFIEGSGIGFTEREKQMIFKKFGKIERYGKWMDNDPDSSGLGLSISKEIIELHGSRIWVESEGRNKGSTFIIRLLFKINYIQNY